MASPKLRAFRSRVLYRGLVVVTAIGRRIPLRVGQFLGRRIGNLAYYVARRERRKALRHIAIAFPDWSEAQSRETIRAMFRHFGMSLFELAWLPNMNERRREETTIVEGIDRILELLDSGRGVIQFTAHCGNWEWLAYSLGTYGRPVSVLHRERDNPDMNRYIIDLRGSAGVRTIGRGSTSSAKEMIQAIRKGGMLAFVLDQNIRTESVKVPFFGVPAPTPVGPVKFAIRTEANISISYIHRMPDGRHHAVFLPPIQCHKDDDPIELAARITRAYEEHIRRNPEQWVWMHDRWKERPMWDVTEQEKSRRGATLPEESAESSRTP
ncbi:MAG TPA: lysophospholipid acyltransferase family protein [Thermoanaerobaculia bacterium]|nr:lysophospholipid acyltransferase family protein [Thermoanaerobaculia bacterium]